MNRDHVKNMYRHDFASFAPFAFRTLCPDSEFQDNWHLDVLAEALRKIACGEIRGLIINLPPRALKSFYASVALPAWVLGRDPRMKILTLHDSIMLGQDLHDQCFQLMRKPRYRSIFEYIHVEEDRNRLITNFGGSRKYMPIHGRLAGLGADIIIIDDPISPLAAQNDFERQQLNRQFDQNILQRLNNKKTGAIILVMQRLHEEDLTAHVLAKNLGWEHINIPAIALEDETWQLSYGQTHIRLQGDNLHEARESRAQLLDMLNVIGGYAFAYQYLQGLYKPRYGLHGEGCELVTPLREGEFWDPRIKGKSYKAFIKITEKELVASKIFGIGSDPCPDNMRHCMTEEEFELAYGGIKYPEISEMYSNTQ